MDRLISEKQIINAIKAWAIPLQVSNSETIENLWVNGVCELIKAIPSAYKGMTNGEVIKAMFSHEDVYKGEFGYDLGGCTIDFDWWNSPYEPQGSEG